MMPRVTVIIATYNWSSVLPYSVGSVARQTFRDFELLVVGDACTDDSEQVVARLIEEYPDASIRWINCAQNAGSQYGPNNEGLKQARGEYIAYLGHDDLWLPHHLELLVAALDAGADVVHGVIAWVTPNGNSTQVCAAHECVAPSSVMHRADVAQRVGGWRPFGEIKRPVDLDFIGRARDAGFRFSFVPRLTTVKFAAAWRRDVYKTRPCSEQAHWFERIGRETDFEAVELSRMLDHASAQLYRPPARIWMDANALLARKVSNRFLYYLRCLRYGSRGAHTHAARKFKGLERKA